MTKEQKENWYNSNEEYDFNLFSSITSGVLFSTIVQGEKYGDDAYATAGTRYFNIEIKNRHINHNQYNTILIESDKYANALNNFIFDKREELYVNFFKDGYMMVWNLNNLKTKPKYSPWRIKSEVYNRVCEGRFELSTKDAALYKITENGIVLIK